MGNGLIIAGVLLVGGWLLLHTLGKGLGDAVVSICPSCSSPNSSACQSCIKTHFSPAKSNVAYGGVPYDDDPY